MKAGIVSAYAAMTVKLDYNDLPSVHALFDAYPGQIAAVILEAATLQRRRLVSSRVCDQ
jgi:glutamate-1-semialdehyde 2,1-aminomutase